MYRLRTAIIHNTISPYRHPLFEELSKSLDLVVYYCSVMHSSRKWDLWPRDYGYKYKVLPRIPFKTRLGDLSLNPSIVREIAGHKPQVIVFGGYVDPTMWLVYAICRILQIPMVYWVESTREPTSFLGKVSRKIRTFFIEKADAIIVPGDLSRRYILSIGVSKSKVFVAPNAIDNELFIDSSVKHHTLDESARDEYGLEGKVVILCIAQLVKRKGIEYLLQSYRRLEQEIDNVALIIVGSGPLEASLVHFADYLRLKEFRILPSSMSFEKLTRLYSIADIFVLPTLEDIWGFVINEAMASGLPIVATQASQAAQEMVQHSENGYLVKKADSERLYEALKDLVNSPDGRNRMGAKSREIVKNEFAVSLMVKGFLAAIGSFIKRQSKVTSTCSSSIVKRQESVQISPKGENSSPLG
jgi:glycosyltransferase involved in cell wall biosynthesis